MRQPFLTSRLQGFGTTIFTEMTLHAQKYDALNLGQGFPNFDGPDAIKALAADAVANGYNQYGPMPGLPDLRSAVAEHRRRFYDIEYDPDAEITITHGATEGIHVCLQALCEVGDEVVVFEPFYDSYRACIAMAGAVDRLYTMEAPDFAIDPERLRRLITQKTRLILLNSPHNPTGKVFSLKELELIAQLAREHDLLVVADEVYEHLVYGEGDQGPKHIPIAGLPGMRERTVTLSSAGKTFSFTGWKIGWMCAPPELTSALRTAHQFVTFSSGTSYQSATAAALRLESEFFDELVADYRDRRDFLCQGLSEVGFDVIVPSGTYFALADIRPLGFDDDVEFCRVLPQRVQVAAIPPTAFYVNKEAGRHLVRFAFCKSKDLLAEGIRRLKGLSK